MSINLRGANCTYSCITEASLAGADARNASFSYANLEYTYLSGVNLDGASLRHANLKYAVFSNEKSTDRGVASVNGTNFTEAAMDGAILLGVDLRHSIGLTQHQLDVAVINDGTKLPNNIHRKDSKESDQAPEVQEPN